MLMHVVHRETTVLVKVKTQWTNVYKETYAMLIYKAITLHMQLVLYEQKGYKVPNNKWTALPS